MRDGSPSYNSKPPGPVYRQQLGFQMQVNHIWGKLVCVMHYTELSQLMAEFRVRVSKSTKDNLEGVTELNNIPLYRPEPNKSPKAVPGVRRQ